MKKEREELNYFTFLTLIITVIIALVLLAVMVKLSVSGGFFAYAKNSAIETNIAIEQEQELSNGKVTVEEQDYNSVDDYINEIAY